MHLEQEAAVLRIRSRLRFGTGYPFSADEQAHLVRLLRGATDDAVHVPVYEYAERLPRIGRDKSSARDVWHPADRDARSADDVAARLGDHLGRRPRPGWARAG